MIWVGPMTVFRCEFNCDIDYAKKRLQDISITYVTVTVTSDYIIIVTVELVVILQNYFVSMDRIFLYI